MWSKDFTYKNERGNITVALNKNNYILQIETMLREKDTTIDNNPIKKIKNRLILLFHIENKTDLLIDSTKKYVAEMVYFLRPMICQKFINLTIH